MRAIHGGQGQGVRSGCSERADDNALSAGNGGGNVRAVRSRRPEQTGFALLKTAVSVVEPPYGTVVGEALKLISCGSGSEVTMTCACTGTR